MIDKFFNYFGYYKQEFHAQGILDIFKLFDSDTINKMKAIIDAFDVEKFKNITDMISVNDQGYIEVKIDLKVKK